MEYKNTIITPKTDFPMKAGLPVTAHTSADRFRQNKSGTAEDFSAFVS